MKKLAWMLLALFFTGCAVTKVAVRYEEVEVAIELQDVLHRG